MNPNTQSARILEDVQIKLSGLWAAAMFSWVYGDLLRIYSGDYILGGEGLTDGLMSMELLWMLSAIIMIIPGIMVFLSLTLKYKLNRWANLVIGIFYTGFNLIGLPTYPSAYDRFLIFVGIIFTALIVWHAWKWPKLKSQPQEGNS